MGSKKSKPVLRTCVCCGLQKTKSTLNRFVWNGTEPELDTKKILEGRGVYCCTEKACLESFFKQQKKWNRYFRLYKV